MKNAPIVYEPKDKTHKAQPPQFKTDNGTLRSYAYCPYCHNINTGLWTNADSHLHLACDKCHFHHNPEITLGNTRNYPLVWSDNFVTCNTPWGTLRFDVSYYNPYALANR